MHKRKQISGQILAVILILLMTVSTIIPFSLLYMHKSSVERMIRKELKKHIPDGDLISFSEFELKNAEWIHEKEFRLDGEMYDVVRTKKEDGQTIHLCFKDSREDKIWKWLHTSSEKDADNKGQVSPLTVLFFSSISPEIPVPPFAENHHHFSAPLNLLQGENITPFTPPKF